MNMQIEAIDIFFEKRPERVTMTETIRRAIQEVHLGIVSSFNDLAIR